MLLLSCELALKNLIHKSEKYLLFAYIFVQRVQEYLDVAFSNIFFINGCQELGLTPGNMESIIKPTGCLKITVTLLQVCHFVSIRARPMTFLHNFVISTLLL